MLEFLKNLFRGSKPQEWPNHKAQSVNWEEFPSTLPTNRVVYPKGQDKVEQVARTKKAKNKATKTTTKRSSNDEQYDSFVPFTGSSLTDHSSYSDNSSSYSDSFGGYSGGDSGGGGASGDW